jgi:hypothetical protein
MLARVEEDLESAYSNPGLLAHELLHKAAFSGGLANSLLPDPASLGGLTGDALREVVAQTFVAGNIAVTGAGVSLAQLQSVSAHGAAALVSVCACTAAAITVARPTAGPAAVGECGWCRRIGMCGWMPCCCYINFSCAGFFLCRLLSATNDSTATSVLET